MPYYKIQWMNDTAPAINAENLNRIEDGIGQSADISNTLTQSGLSDSAKAQAFGSILDELISSVSSGTGAAGTLTDANGKIYLDQLKSLLSHITFTTSGNDADMMIDSSSVYTAGQYGCYLYNGASTTANTSIVDGDGNPSTTDFAHIHFQNVSNFAFGSVAIAINSTDTITINGTNFFDNDAFATVDIDITRIKSDNAAACLIAVCGSNAKGYNYR